MNLRSDRAMRPRSGRDLRRCGSGGLLEIAEVFKSLAIIQADKPLSFREKKMLDCARRMLHT